jgi:anti-sigma-K factor RskA
MIERHANPEDFDLYALGALEGEDEQRFEAHLRACSTCQGELQTARERALLLALAEPPIKPDASLKSRLMERLHAESAGNIPKAAQPDRIRRKSWGLRFSLSFGVTTIILAIATAWLWHLNQVRGKSISELRAQLEAAKQQAANYATKNRAITEALGAPDTVQITLQQQTGGPPGQAHVLYNARMGLVVYSGEIAPAPADKSYQLWLVPSSGMPVSMGLVEANQQNGAVVHLQQGLVAKAFAVTLEQHGGVSQPTGRKVLVGAEGS